MSAADKDIEFIERFFNLELSEEELQVFEERIDTEPDFAAKLDTYKESIDLVEEKHATQNEKLRSNRWKQILIEKEKETKVININWKWIGGIAASLVLAFFGWQYTNHNQHQDLDVLIADSWSKNIGLDYRMMRSANQDSLQKIILTAFDAYEAKNYEEAIAVLEQFDSKTLYYEDALLIKALSLHKEGNTTNALETLKALSQFPTKKKAKVAEWYLGLIYLDLEDIEEAKKYLELPNNKNSEIKLKE